MTYVGNVDLTATSAAASHGRVEAAAASTVRPAAHATGESAASGTARRTEPRLGLTILGTSQPNQSQVEHIRLPRCLTSLT